jgi:hypothetical protein
MTQTTDAAIWTDAENRTWSTAISVNAIRRVKELVGVNPLEVFDGELLARLADDPVLLVNALDAVCKPQADERDVSDEAFGELLVGDTIELAAAALVRGIADFFPKDRRAVLDRLWAATKRTRSEAIQMATDKLDSPLVEQAITGAIRKASDEIDQRLRSFPYGRRFECGAIPQNSAPTRCHAPHENTSGNSPESLASSPVP